MTSQRLSKTLKGERCWPPPVWIMRQAGRYLPEYRAIRSNYRHFFDLVLHPQAAVEISLQPMNRFSRLDAAIIYSDILILPWALGQNATFTNGQAPVMDPLPSLASWPESGWLRKLQPVLDNIKRLRDHLPDDKSVIGFAGAPWTLAAYMLGKDKVHEALSDSIFATEFMKRLSDVIGIWLEKQYEAGADVLMIFESWANTIPQDQLYEFGLRPMQTILSYVEATTSAPCIIFPRATTDLDSYLALSWQGLAVHHSLSISTIAPRIRPNQALMGNLSPDILCEGGERLQTASRTLVSDMQATSQPWIVNLGHGILPTTPIENVEAFLAALPG